jgi:hypothetical protein
MDNRKAPPTTDTLAASSGASRGTLPRALYPEVFSRIGFIVTNLRWRPRKVIQFYNKRGTTEQWIKEGKNAICWTRLSCHDFRDNEVRLQLFGLAYNLGNFVRRLALPRSVKHWSLTALREKLIKIGAKVVSSSPIRPLPVGRGGRAEGPIRGDSVPDTETTFGPRTRLRC